MAEVVVVTGTGTGVGKTVSSAALAAAALGAGRSVCVVKPVQTGVVADEPGDVHEIARLVAPFGQITMLELVRLAEPMAPQAAASRAGVELPAVKEHAVRIEQAAARHDLVLVEGAGGVLVRLDGTGAEGSTVADLAVLLAAEVVVVAGAELGTLNVTELTVEALRVRGAAVRGVLVGRWPDPPGPVERQNLLDLPVLSGVPLLGVVPALIADGVPTIF